MVFSLNFSKRVRKIKKISLSLGLVLCVLAVQVAPSLAIGSAVKSSSKKEKKYPEIEPKKLYDKVWKIIKNDFVDLVNIASKFY